MSARLRKFDRRDRPLSIVPPYRNSEAVHFVEPNALDRTSLPIGEDNGLAYKIGVGLLELTEDCNARTFTEEWVFGARVRIGVASQRRRKS